MLSHNRTCRCHRFSKRFHPKPHKDPVPIESPAENQGSEVRSSDNVVMFSVKKQAGWNSTLSGSKNGLY